MSKKWIVTERYNILLSGGTLIFIMIVLSFQFSNYFKGVGMVVMLVGIWTYIFYKWEHIEND